MPGRAVAMRRGGRLAVWTVIAALAAAAAPAAAVVLPGFRDDLVASVALPTALAFTPDGRLLVTTKTGALRVIQNGSLLPTPALTFSSAQLCSESERGLLGVAVDPDFANNDFIYLFYTFRRPDAVCVNRVSRFTLPAGNVISPGSEEPRIDNMPSPAGNHNAGDLHFGKDGNLYATIGDGGCDYAGDSGCAGANDAARDLNALTGKVLRITPAGGIPGDNPFTGTETERCNVTGLAADPDNTCQEIFATGLRNPFRMAFDPNAAGTRFFINDVGQGAWEEIDLGESGADYGWNCREGAHTNSTTGKCDPTPPGLVDPIFEYAHNTQIPGTTSPTNCHCVSGGAFVPDGLWPGFDGAYLFGDCVCAGIFRLDESGGVFSAGDFGQSLGSVIHLTFGPHGNGQALYYATFAGGGQVRRIVGPVGPLDFHTLTPCRVADTRNPVGPSGGPPLAAGQTRAFPVAGLCGVPATARAVAVNVTVADPTATGHLTLFPGGSTQPTASTINFAAGQNRANNATLELGPAGDLAVFCGIGAGSAHFILDVVGWFE